MSEQEQRLTIVEEAQNWLRTPYHHQGQLKGVGVDCAMLLYKVFNNVGLIPEITFESYSPQWHLNKSDEKYLDWVKQYSAEITTNPQPGDVVLYQFGRCLSHGAIVVQWPTVIHAVIDIGVFLDRGDNISIKLHRPTRMVFYSYWG